MFGKPFGCLMEGKYHDWVSYLFSNLKAACLMSSVKFYPLLSSILYSFIPKKAFEERQQHFDLSTMWVRQRIRAETDRADFLKYILENNNVKEPMTTAEIEASASVLVLAGSETTSTQLLGTIAYLLQHPDKLSKLVHEVRSTFQSESEITLRAVDSLSYLKAVLQENSRMAPSVPGQVPRMVPKGGDTVCGINIPEDVRCPRPISHGLPHSVS